MIDQMSGGSGYQADQLPIATAVNQTYAGLLLANLHVTLCEQQVTLINCGDTLRLDTQRK